MIGASILLIMIVISLVALFSTTIYGIVFFYKNKEYMLSLILGVALIVIIISLVGGLLVELGI